MAASSIPLNVLKGRMRSSVTWSLLACQNLGFLTRSISCGLKDFNVRGPVPTGFEFVYLTGSLTLDHKCLGTIYVCPPTYHKMGEKGSLSVTTTVLLSGAVTVLR